LTILAILRIWYHLNGLCLKIAVSKTEKNYSNYLCQYHFIEIHTKSIISGAHVKYKGDAMLSIIK